MDVIRKEIVDLIQYGILPNEDDLPIEKEELDTVFSILNGINDSCVSKKLTQSEIEAILPCLGQDHLLGPTKTLVDNISMGDIVNYDIFFDCSINSNLLFHIRSAILEETEAIEYTKNGKVLVLDNDIDHSLSQLGSSGTLKDCRFIVASISSHFFIDKEEISDYDEGLPEKIAQFLANSNIKFDDLSPFEIDIYNMMMD